MKINKLLLIPMALGLTAMLVMSGCSSATPVAGATVPPIRIGVNPWIGWGALYIAQDKGFFAKEGVKVDLVNYDSTNGGNSGFASKEIDANTTVLSDSVAQAAAGVPLQVAWIFDESRGADIFVGNASIKSPADLKGKRIGLSYGTFGHIFVLSALAKFGISQDEVTLVNVSGDSVPKALAAGEIDAGHTWDPYVQDALKNGAHEIFSSADTPGIINDVLEVHTSLIQNRPNDVQAMIRAIQDAEDFWNSNPTEGNQIVAKALGDQPSDVSDFLKTDHIFSLSENVDALTPGGKLNFADTIKTISDFFVQQKVIRQAPDSTTLLNSTFALALSNNKQ